MAKEHREESSRVRKEHMQRSGGGRENETQNTKLPGMRQREGVCGEASRHALLPVFLPTYPFGSHYVLSQHIVEVQVEMLQWNERFPTML